MQRGECGGIPGHHQITARRDAGGGREIEPDAITELPSAEVHWGSAFVIQFDPLLRAIGHRIVEDLVDDDIRAHDRHIGASGGGRGGVAPASTVDQAAQAVAPLVQMEPDRTFGDPQGLGHFRDTETFDVEQRHRQPLLAWQAGEQGIELGGDDYVVKPVDLLELAARLRALVRRSHGRPDECLTAQDVVLDPASRTVRRANLPVVLSTREFDLLHAFMLGSGITQLCYTLFLLPNFEYSEIVTMKKGDLSRPDQ